MADGGDDGQGDGVLVESAPGRRGRGARLLRVIADVIEKWHEFMAGRRPGALDELLADDVVFHSPVVFTPQAGKAITTAYLQAATVALPGDEAGPFHYTKQVLAGDTAVLEFETTVGGKYVNGVDIIRVDEHDHIVEFRVMIRPLQAVNAVHAAMGAALQAMGNSAPPPAR